MPLKTLLFTLLLILPTCSPEPGHLPGAGLDLPITSNNPSLLASLLTSTTTSEISRKQADAKLIQQSGKSNPTRLTALEQVLSNSANPNSLRLYALDQLADASPAHLANALLLDLPKFDDTDLLTRACTLLTNLGDDRALAPLIRSLHRALDEPHPTPASLNARPEAPAIEFLSPHSLLPPLGSHPLPEALFIALYNNPIPATQIAALDLLQTLVPPDQLLPRLQQLSTPNYQNSTWLTDLQWYLLLFNTPPIGPNESLWMHQLHLPENASLVTLAAQHHKLLTTEPDYHFAPRFIATLAFTDLSTLKLSRQSLLSDIQSQLATVPHQPRIPQYPGSFDDIDESLSSNAAKLTRADLLTLRLLLQTLTTPASLNELHRQGLEDLADTTTEHGGLLQPLFPLPPTLLIKPYPPMYADNDFEYISSDTLLQQTPTALAQYHFHFQQLHNADRAGPGEGDLHYAHTNRTNNIVITSTKPNQLNIDYYTPTQAVIDLGTYTTP